MKKISLIAFISTLFLISSCGDTSTTGQKSSNNSKLKDQDFYLLESTSTPDSGALKFCSQIFAKSNTVFSNSGVKKGPCISSGRTYDFMCSSLIRPSGDTHPRRFYIDLSQSKYTTTEAKKQAADQMCKNIDAGHSVKT